jgi:hypothetical protein
MSADGAATLDLLQRSNVADIRTGFGAKEMPTKQEDALLARDVDLHFVHRKSASLAKRFDTAVHASPPPTGCGAIIRASA